ncbi:hypothetical protein HQ560_18420, partial [bacterium]|nr:hypothetical protein [bacterium]
MTRAGRALGWLICISGCVALTRRGGDPAAPFTPGKEGWLTLFDGSDMAKWEKAKESDWALKKGVLVGTKGEMASRWHWTDFEMAATVRGRGALRFRVSLAPMPEQAGYALSLVDGTLRKDAVDGPV